MEQSKTCSKCKQIKSLTDFQRRADSNDGLRGECRECRKNRTAVYYEKNKERILARNKVYVTANKEKVDCYKKQWAQSEKAKAYRINYRKNNRAALLEGKKRDYQINKSKRLATAKKWAVKNAEKVQNYQRQYRLENKNNPEWRERKRREANIRRVRKLNNGWEVYSEQQVLKIYGTDCHICNEPIDLNASRKTGDDGWEKSLHIDHLISIAKGGSDILENVRPAHGLCNLKKWAN